MNQNISSYTKDIDFAAALCAKKNHAIEKFNNENVKFIMKVVNSWHKFDDKNDDYIYKDMSGKSLYTVSDNKMDTYLWLTEHMIQAACKYKGNAKFTTYTHSVMNHKFTKSTWLKSIKGNTQYAPKWVQKLGPKYEKFYTLYKQNKNPEKIIKELKLKDLNEYDIKKRELEYVAFINNKTLNNLNIKIKNFEDDENGISEPESNLLPADKIEEFRNIFKNLIKCYKILDDDSKRILGLHWDEKISNDEMKNEPTIKQLLNGKNIYQNIDQIINECNNWLQHYRSDFYKDYQINNGKIKSALKTLIQFFEIDE